MRRFAFAVLLLMTGWAAPLSAQTRIPVELKPDLSQPMDAEATAKIRKYTTAPEFNSPLTDYLPASSTVPSPSAVLSDVAGAPGILPYTEEVHRYFRMLAAASLFDGAVDDALRRFPDLSRCDVEIFYVHRALRLGTKAANRTPVLNRGFAATVV